MFGRILAYVAVKYSAETALCFLWLRSARLEPRPAAFRAWKYGAARLLLGRATMLILQDLSLDSLPEWPLAAALLPVLWLEWSAIDLLILGKGFSVRRLLFGSDRAANLWRGRGVLVSVLANFAGILFGIRVGELWL